MAFPAFRKQHAFRQSSPVEKAMFVMDNVVNAVGRHDVTRFINGVSQGLPPRDLPCRSLKNLQNLMLATGLLVVLEPFCGEAGDRLLVALVGIPGD